MIFMCGLKIEYKKMTLPNREKQPHCITQTILETERTEAETCVEMIVEITAAMIEETEIARAKNL